MMEITINDLPMPTQEQIEEIGERVGSLQLDFNDVNITRLCALIVYQDLMIDQLSTAN